MTRHGRDQDPLPAFLANPAGAGEEQAGAQRRRPSLAAIDDLRRRLWGQRQTRDEPSYPCGLKRGAEPPAYEDLN